jgi:hypothetical protein
VLVYHNRRDPRVFDLYRVDLATRRETLVAQNPGDATSAITAPDGSFQGWNKSVAAQRRAEAPPRRLAERKPALLKTPYETFRPLGMNADRSLVWALSDRGRDRIALVLVHPTLGWEKVVFEDPVADVSRVTMSRVTHAPLVAQAQAGYPRVAILDAALREDLEGLLKEQGGQPFGLAILGMDSTERRMVVSVFTDRQHRTYLVDRSARTHTLLAEAVAPDLAGALSPMQPVTITSRDGLPLPAYLTLPGGVSPKRLPMVLYVHGGP